ncbi:MAG: efflux RND transporter periplasmic adaptor subunit [Candidatus Neomarinimicrobiota bacterium]|nr:efflux RND transporter periplasmic adaptor subunit [Candidatus Neomarinimicrobiota bacterium]
MKNYFGLLFLVISVVLAFLMIKNKSVAVSEDVEIDIPYVKTMMLLPQTVNASIASQGVISPESALTLLSELNSKVDWISPSMETGSSFSKGDTLLILDKRDYELVLITAESNVLNAEVNLEREKAESDLASKEWKRVGTGAGSDLALRKPQLAQAKATLAAAQATLERAQRNLKRTVFIAPFDGRVRTKNVDPGATIFPGTALGNIYATESFEVRLPIADQDVPFTGLDFNGRQIPEDKQLDVKFSLGNSNLKGKVVRAEAEVDPMTRMLSIVARIDNTPSISSSNPIAVGQFVQATIYGIEIPEIVVLPRTAVRDEGVWIVDTSMILYNRPVDVLRYENEFALIGEGIEPGDRLLTSRLSSLVNGLKVTFELN